MTVQANEMPAVRAPEELVGQRLGQCRLVGHLSRGGMGDVFDAEHIHLKRRVAIKIPRLDNHNPFFNQQQLLTEARFLARVAHVNVVAVHDLAYTDEGLAYLVMEYLAGEALDRILVRSPTLQLPETLHVIREMARGLGACHRAGILVSDVKPENIMVVGGPLVGLPPQGTVWIKIIDLGGSHPIARDGEPAPKTPSVRVGTPGYSSPELILGHPLTPASDVYALGVLLYELIAGTQPFHDEDDKELLRMHVEEPPAPLGSFREEVPPNSPLDRFVMRCLAKQPALRPANMVSFLNELDQAARRSAIGGSGDERLSGDLTPRRKPEVRSQRATRPMPYDRSQ